MCYQQISGFGADGHSPRLPHLLHTSNCSLVEMTLQGLETSDQFEGKSRFALEMLFASAEASGGPGAQVAEHHSLDDEHTPGVFTVSLGQYCYKFISIFIKKKNIYIIGLIYL